jgi:hexokinase
MIGKEDNQDEVTFKVADRRKFNPDGSLKEGVTLEPAKPEEKTEPATAKTESTSATSNAELEGEATTDSIPQEESEIPGVDDPASFINFLSTLATNAAAALGAVPHPATGKRTLDLDTGKYWLDVLGMLRDKTKGNLHKEESRLLDGLLADLRMQYVQLVRATEEKLKAQAAQKFSSSDILGKK